MVTIGVQEGCPLMMLLVPDPGGGDKGFFCMMDTDQCNIHRLYPSFVKD